ncbi:unnamed protein product [Citrullus colocynthis]|uniref:Uncharacterized protein n=1 Tax=Citrullus colocynthis TaxID=252529 RepID=A0ABP0YXJ9_9ROSI
MNQNEMGEESFIFFLWEFISFFPSSELRNLKGGNGFGLVWFCLGISVFSSKNQRGHLVVARVPNPLSSLRFEMNSLRFQLLLLIGRFRTAPVQSAVSCRLWRYYSARIKENGGWISSSSLSQTVSFIPPRSSERRPKSAI